jgi:hypothetical protein
LIGDYQKDLIKIGKQVFLLNFHSRNLKVSIIRIFLYSNAFFVKRLFAFKNNARQKNDGLIVCSNDYQIKKATHLSEKISHFNFKYLVVTPEGVFNNVSQGRFIFFIRLYFSWLAYFIRVLKSFFLRKSPLKIMLLKNSMRYTYYLFCARDILSESTKIIAIDPSDPFSRAFMYARDCYKNKVLVIPFGFYTRGDREIPIDPRLSYGVPGMYSKKIIKERSKSKSVSIIGDVFEMGNMVSSNLDSSSVLFISAPHRNKAGTNGQVTKKQYRKILHKLIKICGNTKKLKVRPHPVDNNLNYLNQLASEKIIKISDSHEITEGILVGFASTMFFDAISKNIPFICLVDGMENDYFELKKNGYPYVFDFNSNLENIFHLDNGCDFDDILKKYIERSGDGAINRLVQFLKKI